MIQKSQPGGAEEPIYIEDQRVALGEIESIIEKKRALNPQMDVVIEGDAVSTLGMFAKVVSELKKMGIDNVGGPWNRSI